MQAGAPEAGLRIWTAGKARRGCGDDLIHSDQLRTKNFRITQIQAPGSYPVDTLPARWQELLEAKFIFAFAGPGWSLAQCLAEDFIEAGPNYIQYLQTLYDEGGDEAVRGFVEAEMELERKNQALRDLR